MRAECRHTPSIPIPIPLQLHTTSGKIICSVGSCRAIVYCNSCPAQCSCCLPECLCTMKLWPTSTSSLPFNDPTLLMHTVERLPHEQRPNVGLSIPAPGTIFTVVGTPLSPITSHVLYGILYDTDNFHWEYFYIVGMLLFAPKPYSFGSFIRSF